jgi:hypothetical protein
MKVAILIPTHKYIFNYYEEQSISKVFSFYKNFLDIYFICPENIKENFKNYGVKIASFPDKFFLNHKAYNKLCMNKSFYYRFKKYEYILISQTDSIILEDKLSFWCQSDLSYIGGPSFHKKNITKEPKSPKYFCNGGFSLRKVNDFIEVLESNKIFFKNIDLKQLNQIFFRGYFLKYSKLFFDLIFTNNKAHFIDNFFLNEDVFFTYFAKLFSLNFKTPKNVNDCASFAFSDGIKYFIENFRNTPFGIHGYNREIHSLLKEKKLI